MKISELVGNDYDMWEDKKPKWHRWQMGDFIFLISGTGSGKTTLALENAVMSYIKHDKNILYLVPRTILAEQIKRIIQLKISRCHSYNAAEYNEKFTICTYHELEKILLNNNEFLRNIPLSDFDVIICDEFHYFTSDALFNKYTKLSYDFIFHNEENVYEKRITLFLTATPNNIMDYMQQEMLIQDINDLIPEKYGDVIPKETEHMQFKTCAYNKNDVKLNMYIYQLNKTYDYLNIKYIIKDDEILEIIKDAKGKTIVFVSSKMRGETLQKNLKKCKIDSAFITADNKNTDAKKTVEKLTKEHYFDEKVLITTSVLNVGVSIEDDKVDNIIIAINEPTEFLQMLGRIRLEDNTEKRINLFIFKRSYKYFQNLLDGITEKVDCCEYLEKYRIYKKETVKIEEKDTYDDNGLVDEMEKMEEEEERKRLYGEDTDEEEDTKYKGKKYSDNLNYMILKNLNEPNDLLNGYKKFLYFNEYQGIVILNSLSACYVRQLQSLYEDICKNIQKDENYFIKEQLRWLGREDDFSDANFYSLELKNRHIQILQAAIESKSKEIKNGIPLENRTEILAFFQPLVRNIDSKFIKNNVKLSMPKFNKFCEEHRIPYEFIQEKDKVTRRGVYYLRKINLTSQLISGFNSLLDN